MTYRYLAVVGDDSGVVVTEAQKRTLESLPECDAEFTPVVDATGYDDTALIDAIFEQDADQVLEAKAWREREDMRDFCRCGELRHAGPCEGME